MKMGKEARQMLSIRPIPEIVKALNLQEEKIF